MIWYQGNEAIYIAKCLERTTGHILLSIYYGHPFDLVIGPHAMTIP